MEPEAQGRASCAAGMSGSMHGGMETEREKTRDIFRCLEGGGEVCVEKEVVLGVECFGA